ncbi:MAG: ABC transporter transmembrane domain-containing protein [Gammaproteobacteria bacterium]|nr:ABC transporter transmembrane domain-containing protein [Gammaproteobacteria bacterium]
MNDKQKALLLWDHTRGYRLIFTAAIVAMAVGYCLHVRRTARGKVRNRCDRTRRCDGVAGLDAPALREAIAFGPEGAGLFEYLLLAAIATLGLTAIAGVFLYIRGRCSAVASEGIVRELRDRIYSHLEHLPSAWHDRADTGDLLQRCSSDMETVRVFLAGQVIEIARAVLMLLTVLPILFWLDVRMAWLSLASMPRCSSSLWCSSSGSRTCFSKSTSPKRA